MSFDTSDSYVNKLTVGEFNLCSCKKQIPTGLNLLNGFIKVRNLLWYLLFSLHLHPTFEIFSLKIGLKHFCQANTGCPLSFSIAGKLRIVTKSVHILVIKVMNVPQNSHQLVRNLMSCILGDETLHKTGEFYVSDHGRPTFNLCSYIAKQK